MENTEYLIKAEQAIYDYTASSEWRQVKYMKWTSAEVQDIVYTTLKKETTQLREENQRMKIGILKVRDELSKNDVPSAYHELYRLADPTFEKKEPWTEFEQLLKETNKTV